MTTCWWNSIISNQLYYPSVNDKCKNLNINFGNKKYNKKFCHKYKFKNNTTNNFIFFKNDEQNTQKNIDEIDKINLGFEKNISKINSDTGTTPEKKQIKIKSLTTKKDRKILNIDNIQKTKKIFIYPSKEQQIIINSWFNESTKVYNKCVDLFNSNNAYFNNGTYMKYKTIIFNELYGENEKNCPYDTLTDEVRIFLSNLKSCYTNLNNGHITNFTLTYKNVLKKQCIFIPKTAIKNNSFYKNILGVMKGMNNVNIENICDSRLYYDKVTKKYNLCIPYHETKKIINEKEEVVALDPGEKIFLSYFAINDYGHLGKNIRTEILKEEKKIRKFQKIYSKKKNISYNERLKKHNGNIIKMNEEFNKLTKKEQYTILKNEKLRNRTQLKKRIRKCYERIQNKVKELHNKCALYLCKNYKNVLIPIFETQNMVREKTKIKPIIEKIKQEKEESKKELKKITKRKRLNKKVKFCLNMLSHYKFKQHLKNKGLEYGCKIIDVTEEYTSLTCTRCGKQSKNYDSNRIKQCECGYKIDRDIGGSRNILIKNIDKVIKPLLVSPLGQGNDPTL